jgi:lipoprotein NlpI
MGQLENAIRDYSTSLKLNDRDAETYWARGRVLTVTGQHAEALSDFNSAIRAREIGDAPPSADDFMGRGIVRFARGEYHAAAADFRKAGDINVRNPYAALLSFLALARVGQDAKAELTKRGQALESSKWAGMFAKLYLGQATMAEARAASAPPGFTKEAWHCEQRFFLGMHGLVGGDRASSEPLLREAADPQCWGYSVHEIAKAELRRLDG